MIRISSVISSILLFVTLSMAETPSGTPPQDEHVSDPRKPKEKPLYRWIEAEEFNSLGGWIPIDENSALMGRTTGKNTKSTNLSASTKITWESPGNFHLWVRTKDSKNARIARDFSIAINKVSSTQKLGIHGNDGWAWQNAGEFRLEKGEVAIELIDTSQYYARCDRLLLTNDRNFVPKGVGGDRNTDHVRPENPSAPHYIRANFNDLKVGSLAGQGGGEGFDANRGWSVRGDIQVHAGDLQMPSSQGSEYIRSQSGTPSQIRSATADTSHAMRPFATPMKGRTWFSFLVQPHDGSSTAGIKLLPGEDPTKGYEILANGTDLSFTGSNTSETKKIREAFPLGKTSLVIGRCDLDADRDGRRFLALWINPRLDQLGSPLINEVLSDSIESITHLAVVMSAEKSPTTPPFLDEIIVSNHPDLTGFHHVTPRKRHSGQWHIPIKPTDHKTELPPPGYKLVFSDEFNENHLDLTKWNHRLRDKPDSAQEAENVELRDGNLLIHTKKQRVGKYNYTGGGIISKPLFVYGYYEARFKIPSAEGWHTAFWTMPEYEPKELRNTEIDFCEQDSGDPNYYSLGLINHREKGWNESNIGRWVVDDVPSMKEEFVVIAADFTPQSIRFYMNGRLTKEVDSRLFPHGPATVQLSCIASRKKGDRFQDDAHLPSQATFDYVRVYQHPQYAGAEAAAKTKVVMPTLPLPPISERRQKDAASGELD